MRRLLLALPAALVAVVFWGGTALALPPVNGTPWFYCTDDPCNAFTTSLDPNDAVTCDHPAPGADDGVLLWNNNALRAFCFLVQ